MSDLRVIQVVQNNETGRKVSVRYNPALREYVCAYFEWGFQPHIGYMWIRKPEGDYFTDDKGDALLSALAMAH